MLNAWYIEKMHILLFNGKNDLSIKDNSEKLIFYLGDEVILKGDDFSYRIKKCLNTITCYILLF